MGRINVLDKHTAELIAAGEVVERPSSVIKELLENSIDAGAKFITVEIKNGGTTFMRVTDDGCGFLREDVKKAFLRHATSKVATQNDLDSIATLGFRGEALASISAVAKVELITMSEGEDVGTYYVINGGEEVNFDDAGCSKGSTIIIRDLFYNIPARQKFLKKDVSEGNAVAQVVDRLALSHPEVSFTFIRDSKQVLKTSGDGKLYSAIYAVFGREFANSLIDVDYELGGIKVTGYISKPVAAKASRSMQTFFVNNRYVRSRTAAAALDEAAKGSVMVGKFLCCVLNIELPYTLVDVNVHPAKIEVRFQNERPLFDAVYHAVKGALYKGDMRKVADLTSVKQSNPFTQFDLRSRDVRPANTPISTQKPQTSDKSKESSFDPIASLDLNADVPVETPKKAVPYEVITPKNYTPPYKRDIALSDRVQINNYNSTLESILKSEENHSVLDKSECIYEQTGSDASVHAERHDDTTENTHENSPVLFQNDTPDYKYIGEVFRTYIVIEIQNEIMFIDKHALHERIIYNQLKENPQNSTQLLLVPESVTLSKSDYSVATDNIEMFTKYGFEVEDFGNSTLLVRSAPQYITGEDIGDTITEMITHIALNKQDIKTEKMDWIFHNIACRAAVKAGNKSTEPELKALVAQMLHDDSLRYCPHGRPVSVILKRRDVEKLFGRV
ncbi:MAG: DNA mismatch repair endonuclease MutL [Eubacteriales bacterium]|nr:DNA mismatch repair endonuclease MutL [Eubacteriales bacterium]